MHSFLAKKQNALLLILLLSLSFFIIKPLFHPGFFTMHDDVQVARVYEMTKMMKDGIFPVRWAPDLGFGYGYPLFNFYGPFPYYIGAVFALFGIDMLIATKIMIGLGMVLSGIGMFLLAKRFWGTYGGLMAALLYLYAPYHAVQLYVRGSIAEMWAYALIPFLFLGFYQVYHLTHIKKREKRSIWIWSSLGTVSLAALILSHTLTAMMVAPFFMSMVAFLIVFAFRKKSSATIWYLLVMVVSGFLLSSFFWLPIVFEAKYTNVSSVITGGSVYSDHFVCLPQLWSSPWGFGGSAIGCADGLSFMIGKIHMVGAFAGLVVSLFALKRNKAKSLLGLFAFGAFLFCSYLTLQSSQWIWDTVKPMAFFQFPWRFLVLIIFFASFLGGAIVWFFHDVYKLQKQIFIFIFIILFLSVPLFYVKRFVPEKIVSSTTASYTAKANLLWYASNASYEYMPSSFAIPKEQSQIKRDLFTASEKADITIRKETNTTIEAQIATDKRTNITLHMAYFPFWRFSLDGKDLQGQPVSDGLKFSIPQGAHMFRAYYEETIIEKVGNILSFASILFFIFAIIVLQKRILHEKTI